MAILAKTMADLTATYASTPAFRVLFMQIVPPNLYALVRDERVDNHLEAWSVAP